MSKIEVAARAAHEANRAYCLSLGDTSQVAWEDAPKWQTESAALGAEAVSRGLNAPEASHVGWMAQKYSEGWVYGAVKDAEAKTHPCLVPYDELSAEQKRKDSIFVSVVQAVLGAF